MPIEHPSDAQRGERIAKLLARAGVASRRDIERMIEEGRVALNGRTVETPATLLTSLDGVTVDGDPVAAAEPARLFLFHKPSGVLTAERDPKGRPTIYDRLPKDLPRLVPVGRLDLNTEGLLLLTTDGGLKRQLELPATGVERAYRARAYGPVTQAQLESLIEGVEIEGVRYGSIDANLERRTGANVWIEMILTEGKNREVRRVLEYLGLQVGRLIRTRYGPFVLGDMPVGTIGEVRAADLTAFRQTLGTRPNSAPPIRTDPVGPRPRAAERTRGAGAPQRGAPSAPGAPARGPGAKPRPARPDARTPRPDARPDAPRPATGRAPMRAAAPAPAARQGGKPASRQGAEPETVTLPGRSPRPPQRKTGWARPKPKTPSGGPKRK